MKHTLSVLLQNKPGALSRVTGLFSGRGFNIESLCVAETFDPRMKLVEKEGVWSLEMTVDPAWKKQGKRPLVTTELLGKAVIPDAPFENPDGTPYRIDADYFGEKRDASNPAPGPFRFTGENKVRLNVWPKGE